MERTSSSAVMRLGPLARRLLARRRRWLRWAAIALAALTALSAAAQLHHRPAPRRTRTPAVGVPGGPPAPPFYGVAGVVPPGMRAVNLIVPAAETFEGRLVPSSRVDVLAAFDLGQDRAVRRLASGIVLHVTSLSAPARGGALSTLPVGDGRFGAAPVVELALAVPAAVEREVVMAQAFGRVFVAVEPMTAGVSTAGAVHRPYQRAAAPPDGVLSLRHYLGLPAAPSPVAAPALVPTAAGFLPPPFPWTAGPAATANLARGSAPPADAHHGDVAVEIIEGTTRTIAEVVP